VLEIADREDVSFARVEGFVMRWIDVEIVILEPGLDDLAVRGA
jgi:hypothetical protein